MDNLITIKKRTDLQKSNEAFAEFMNLTEAEFNLRASRNPGLYCDCSSQELEKVAVSLLKEIAPQTPFNQNEIKLISGLRFPDIIAGKNFGVEVKSTCKNHWTSTGSSIIESTREENVENIYMLFGKLGGNPAEFRCRPYAECLYDIAVTHSPRYLINMDIPQAETIFNKMNTTYDEFRKSKTAIETVREYYYNKAKREGKQEMPWWFSNSETAGNINVRLWSTCSIEERNILKAKMIILFPEILDRQYANMALWLCSYHSIIVHNARDMMSASGQYKRIKDGSLLPKPIPHIVGAILEVSHIIKDLFCDNTFIENEFKFYRQDIMGKDYLLYVNWLRDINARINYMFNKNTYPKDEIPFIKWFEDGVILAR